MTIRVPSGLNDTHITPRRVPLQVEQGVPVLASHTFAVLVHTAGDDPRPVRAERHAQALAVCPLRSSRAVPVRASHTFAVLSPLPVTIRVPSGLNDALNTRSCAP